MHLYAKVKLDSTLKRVSMEVLTKTWYWVWQGSGLASVASKSKDPNKWCRTAFTNIFGEKNNNEKVKNNIGATPFDYNFIRF